MRTIGLGLALLFGVSTLAIGEGSGRSIRPIANPVYLDSADVGMSVHPFFLHHEFPSTVNTTLGPVPLGGDAQIYAVQFEVPINEDLSIIAVKDGWIDFNPDNTDEGMFSEEDGLADLAAGLKWVVYRENESVVSVRGVFELPTGDDEVWQGNGDGSVNPAVTGQCRHGPVQLIGTAGFTVPFDDGEESTMFYNGWHVSANVGDKLFPLVELNHFRVISEGDGEVNFTDHVGGGVPGVARFEAVDLINLGAANAEDNADLVTLALGARLRLSDRYDIGGAYEFPLTDEEDSLIDSRITVDLVVNL